MELQQYRQSVSYKNCLWIPHLRFNMNSSWWAIRLQSYLLLQKTDIAEMGSWINIVFHFQCGMLNLSQPQEIFIITLSERGKKFPQWETCTSYQPNYFCHHRNDNKKSGHILQNKLRLWHYDFDCQWIEVLYNPCFTVVMINNSLILKGNNISCII